MLAVLTNMRSDKLRWKMRFGGRWPLVEDDLWWKMTFSGRRPSEKSELLLLNPYLHNSTVPVLKY